MVAPGRSGNEPENGEANQMGVHGFLSRAHENPTQINAHKNTPITELHTEIVVILRPFGVE